MSSFQLMQLTMNSGISANKTNRSGVGSLESVYLEAEATIKMPRITTEQADESLLARVVKALATKPDFNAELVECIQTVLSDDGIRPGKRRALRNLLTFVKLAPHIWETDPKRTWRLLKEMYEDGRLSDRELDVLLEIYASGVDIHVELEKVMERAERGEITEDEMLTVSDELRELARAKESFEWKVEQGAALELNTSAK